MNTNEVNKKSYNAPLIYAICGVLLLVIAVAGSAYAYFTASANANNSISGSTLDVSLGVTATRVSKGTGKLIPIYDGSVSGHASQLSTAATSTNDCVDKNGNTVCQIYEIAITNTGTDATTVDTTLALTGSTNLKWANMTNRTTVGTTHVKTDTSVATGISLSGSGTVKQYIMVYINNTGANQTTDDGNKTFTGSVTVTASTGAQVEATF